jgi:hypothetical protein
MKVGDTGIIVSGINPETGDCFWNAVILEVVDATRIYVELENGMKGLFEAESFTPRYMKDAPSPAVKNYLDDNWAGIV